MSQKNFRKLAASVFIGAGIGILSSAILIFLMASALVIGDVPAFLLSPVTVVILAFGGFAGGFASARLFGERGFICGAFSGAVFFIIAWAAGAFFENAGFGTAAIIKAAMMIISGSLGGIIGINYIKRK